MMTQLLRRWLSSLASGGTVPHRPDEDDSIPVMLTPGEEITDPARAEALGLTVDARRMRERTGDDGDG